MQDLELALAQALEKHLGKSTSPNLVQSIRYSLLAPGKRFRPRLLLASAATLGVPEHVALPAALALEMVHCFTLIHDDLPCMDDDDLRRGMPSNHVQFGEGLALLAGDALVPLATEVFLESALPPERLLTGLRRFLGAITGVISGQAAEGLLTAAGSSATPEARLERVERMHAQKTGALFEAAVLVPQDFAGIADESPEGRALASFARGLGLAFQAADDLEDLPGGEPDSTSILSCLSPVEAQARAQALLRSGIEAVSRHWGERANALTLIGEEVALKLSRACGGPK